MNQTKPPNPQESPALSPPSVPLAETLMLYLFSALFVVFGAMLLAELIAAIFR